MPAHSFHGNFLDKNVLVNNILDIRGAPDTAI